MIGAKLADQALMSAVSEGEHIPYAQVRKGAFLCNRKLLHKKKTYLQPKSADKSRYS